MNRQAWLLYLPTGYIVLLVQVCRNTNQIKICMETGRTVILLNLDNYESLYDVLNQYYMYYGGVRYVDLGLQTHRVKCRVHDDFKWVLHVLWISSNSIYLLDVVHLIMYTGI